MIYFFEIDDMKPNRPGQITVTQLDLLLNRPGQITVTKLDLLLNPFIFIFMFISGSKLISRLQRYLDDVKSKIHTKC